MALWKAREGKVEIKSWILRSWHCGRQGKGSLNKEVDFRYGIVEGKGGKSLNKEFDFSFMALWKGKGGKARGGSLNKEADFRFMALWKAGGGKV